MLLIKDISTLFTGKELLHKQSVVIEEDKIQMIIPAGKEAEHVNLSDYEIIDATGKTVLPGFVDSHTHPVFAGDRAFELGLKLQGKTYLEIFPLL